MFFTQIYWTPSLPSLGAMVCVPSLNTFFVGGNVRSESRRHWPLLCLLCTSLGLFSSSNFLYISLCSHSSPNLFHNVSYAQKAEIVIKESEKVRITNASTIILDGIVNGTETMTSTKKELLLVKNRFFVRKTLAVATFKYCKTYFESQCLECSILKRTVKWIKWFAQYIHSKFKDTKKLKFFSAK